MKTISAPALDRGENINHNREPGKYGSREWRSVQRRIRSRKSLLPNLIFGRPPARRLRPSEIRASDHPERGVKGNLPASGKAVDEARRICLPRSFGVEEPARHDGHVYPLCRTQGRGDRPACRILHRPGCRRGRGGHRVCCKNFIVIDDVIIILYERALPRIVATAHGMQTTAPAFWCRRSRRVVQNQ